jgi:hypothetical protein
VLIGAWDKTALPDRVQLFKKFCTEHNRVLEVYTQDADWSKMEWTWCTGLPSKWQSMTLDEDFAASEAKWPKPKLRWRNYGTEVATMRELFDQ